MRQFERKHVYQQEIKAEDNGIIEAYASVFDKIDSYGDVIKKGSFKKTIKERKDRIKVLFNHNSRDLPVGKPKEMGEDSTGLHTATKMSAIQLGQDIYTLAKEEALDSLSIGYYAMKVEYAKEEDQRKGIYRFINEIKLIEYSFVVFPANELAVITGLKSVEDLELQLKQWCKIYEADAGKILNKQTAGKVVTALEELKGIILSAGQTTDDAGDESEQYSLLEALEAESKRLERPDILRELRTFGRSLGVNSETG